MQAIFLAIGLVLAACGGALAVSEADRNKCDNPSRNPEAAIKACSDIIDMTDIGYVLDAAYFNRGIAYKVKGDYGRAIADFGEAIELNPGYADAYFHRAIAYKARGDYDRAIADFDQTIRLDPKDPEALDGRGEAYSEKGDYERAIADFDRALGIDSTMQAAASHKAVALEKLAKRPGR